MNGKKYRRKAPKLTQKVDRGGQNHRAMEGKSNIAAKRVTLLPGFMINGFTSKTVQKVKAVDDLRKNKNHLIHEDLKSFLGQEGKHHPRRSQRIMKKHIDQCSTISPKMSRRPSCDNLVSAVTNVNNMGGFANNLHENGVILNAFDKSALESDSNLTTFKSILKKNSKSLFKDIRDRFSKVNIHNAETLGQKPVPREKNQGFDRLRDTSGCLNENPELLKQHRNHFEGVLLVEPQDLLRMDLNQSFCRNLEKQICVAFKRNPVDECRANIKKEVEIVKLALDGKIETQETFEDDPEENEAGADAKDGPALKLYPLPPRDWIYSTPPNQKIGMPDVVECQLKTGVLCNDKNRRNLYEVKPSFNVDLSKLKRNENVPIDERFMRKVAQVRRTPANFQFGGYRGDNGAQTVCGQPWGNPLVCAEASGQKELFVNPNCVNRKTRSVFPTYLEEHIPTPQVLQNTFNNSPELADFTFLEEGNDFAMRERKRRKPNDGEFMMKRRSVFITEPLDCDKQDKMFNFGSQERSIFDFGRV